MTTRKDFEASVDSGLASFVIFATRPQGRSSSLTNSSKGARQQPMACCAASWRADKLLKQRGHFDTVQFLTEDVTGHREWFENDWSNAPAAATDPEVLAGLASTQPWTSPRAASCVSALPTRAQSDKTAAGQSPVARATNNNKVPRLCSCTAAMRMGASSGKSFECPGERPCSLPQKPSTSRSPPALISACSQLRSSRTRARAPSPKGPPRELVAAN